MKRGEIAAFAAAFGLAAGLLLGGFLQPEAPDTPRPAWSYAIPPDNELVLGLWKSGPESWETALIVKAGPEYILAAPKGVETVSRGHEPPMAWTAPPGNVAERGYP